MRKIDFVYFIFALCVTGCLPVLSLHPLYDEKTITYDETLLGRWTDDVNNADQAWVFETHPDEEKAYQLKLIDKGKIMGLFTAHLVQLEDKFFIDAFPQEPPCDADSIVEKHPNEKCFPYNAVLLAPCHAFMRVEKTDKNLQLSIMFGEDFKKLPEIDPNEIQYTEIDDDVIVLTSPTNKLQKFVLKYSDSDLFLQGDMLTRTAKTKSCTPKDTKECKKAKKENQ